MTQKLVLADKTFWVAHQDARWTLASALVTEKRKQKRSWGGLCIAKQIVLARECPFITKEVTYVMPPEPPPPFPPFVT